MESGCQLECLWSPFSDVLEYVLRWRKRHAIKNGGGRERCYTGALESDLKIPALPLPGSVTRTKLLTLSEAQSRRKVGMDEVTNLPGREDHSCSHQTLAK